VKKLLTFVAVVALATPSFAGIIVDSQVDNGDGTTTFQLSVDTLNEVSFLDITISGNYGLVQNPGGATYAIASPSPWKPAVVFSSDAALAANVDLGPPAAYDGATDTVIDDLMWPGKVAVDLDPANDGSSSVRVALASFTGGIGGPLPGGPLYLGQVTSNNGPQGRPWLCITGVLQSDSDQDGSIGFCTPEPTSALLAVMGAFGVIASGRRQRRQLTP
jgi:hypothetical protein